VVEPLATRVIERHEDPREPPQRRVRSTTIDRIGRCDAVFGVGSPVGERMPESIEIIDQRREIDVTGRAVAVIGYRSRDFVHGRQVIERIERGVQHAHERREIHLQVAAEDRKARDRRQIVRRVPGRTAAVAANGVIPAPAALGDGDVRQKHVEGGRTDLVERVIAGAERAHPGCRLAHGIGNRVAAQRARFGHPHHFFVRRRIDAPGGVDVQVCDAPLVEVVGELVRVPRGPGVPAGRMPRPPRHADAALETSAKAVQRARELQQCGVADRVVADADIPRIVVTVHEHEFIRIVGARDLGDRQQARRPSLAQPGANPDPRTVRGQCGQPGAIRRVHADDRRPRLPRQRVRRRRTPDRRADPLVDVGARMNEDLCDGPSPLERMHGPGHRVPFGEHDFAGDRIGRELRRCHRWCVEEIAGAARVFRRHITQFAIDFVAVRGQRKRGRSRCDKRPFGSVRL
jgi:hypothetical protein